MAYKLVNRKQPFAEAARPMDLQIATRLSGRKWQPARIAALVFFGLTCGLLVSSLLGASRSGFKEEASLRSLVP